MTSAPRSRRAARPRPQRVEADRQPAREDPIARIAVDVSLPHLDRPFDYLVARQDSAAAQPGVRVRVRFAGRLVDGFVLERVASSDHTGRLAYVHRVVSPEVVLTAPVARLCRAVADRYAGTMADVLRLAVPPRHGRTEAEWSEAVAEDPAATDGPAAPGDRVATDSPTAGPDDPAAPDGPVAPVDPVVLVDPTAPVGSAAPGGPAAAPPGWAAYPAGPSYLQALSDGRVARAVWSALPGEDWCMRLAEAAAVTWSAGRGALLVVPDARDLARLKAAVATRLPAGAFVTLSADAGPAARYRQFLAASRGAARVVLGTRSAIFAPVRRLALVAVFDDGDDLYAEPRAPYPHAREVAMLRSAQESAALLVGGFARTAEAQLLVESGWARPIEAPRDRVRRAAPRIEAAGDDYATGADSPAASARLTPAAFRVVRQCLTDGLPVLVQVPRGGYAPSLACAQCRRPARCRRCAGPLAVPPGARTPACRWCGAPALRWVCPGCGGGRLRFAITGVARTAEEIGRAFPGAQVMSSAGGAIRDEVPAQALIVIATPGAEPVAVDGYGAALLLDGGLLLGRPDLRAAEETLRRWMRAACLVRPGHSGGRVVVGADASLPTVQALLRWDPAHHAAGELAARRELGFPPAAAMASIEGREDAVSSALTEFEPPSSAEVLGPVAAPSRSPRRESGQGRGGAGEPESDDAGEVAGAWVRALIRVPQAERRGLVAALRVLASSRSARKADHPVRIDVDPIEIG